MKKLALISSLAAAALCLHAQAQAPTPAPTPEVLLQGNPDNLAAVAAERLVAQINFVASNIQHQLEVGIAARGTQPAIPGSAIKSKIKPEDLAKIEAALKALKGDATQ